MNKEIITYLLILLIVSNTISEEDTFEENDTTERVEGRNKTFEGFVVHPLDAEIEAYPHAVCLVFKVTRPTLCSASLISVQIIISAATCTAEFHAKGGSTTAYMGHEKPKYATVTRKVVNYRTHPRFDHEKRRNNVAIMFLDSPVVFGKTVKKIVLPNPRGFKSTVVAYGVGWGRQNLNNQHKFEKLMDRELKGTKQKIIDLDDCKKKIDAAISGMETVCGLPVVGQFYKDDAGAGLVYRMSNYMFLGAVFSYVYDAVAVYTTLDVEWIKRLSKEMYRQSCNIKKLRLTNGQDLNSSTNANEIIL